MTGQTVRPHLVERHDLAADAFLLAGLIFLIGILIQTFAVFGFDGEATLSMWTELIGIAAIVVAVIGAPLAVWVLHGHHLKIRDALGALLGLVVGGVAGIAVFFLVFQLWRFVPAVFDRDQYGPLDLGILMALAAAGFLVGPVKRAIVDLRGERRQVRVDWVRIGALAALVAVVLVSVFLGQAEVGLWLVPIGAGAAMAIIGAELIEGRLARKSVATV